MEKEIVIIGRGVVGRELQILLEKKGLKPILLSRTDAKKFDYTYASIVFLATSAEDANALKSLILTRGAKVVDLSSSSRKESPLIVPEVNKEKIQGNLVATPNCVATLIALALAPIHRCYHVKRVIATTYQAVSGAGQRGIDALDGTNTFFKEPIANNLFIHENFEEEESKIREEVKLLLESPNLLISATSVRVPIYRAHMVSLNVELKEHFELDAISALLNKVTGLEHSPSPTPLKATGKKEVLWGRLRRDTSHDNTIELILCGDQLLKGAALNALQIGELLCPSLLKLETARPTSV